MCPEVKLRCCVLSSGYCLGRSGNYRKRVRAGDPPGEAFLTNLSATSSVAICATRLESVAQASTSRIGWGEPCRWDGHWSSEGPILGESLALSRCGFRRPMVASSRLVETDPVARAPGLDSCARPPKHIQSQRRANLHLRHGLASEYLRGVRLSIRLAKAPGLIAGGGLSLSGHSQWKSGEWVSEW